MPARTRLQTAVSYCVWTGVLGLIVLILAAMWLADSSGLPAGSLD